MFDNENRVRVAVDRAGGPTKISNMLGVSNAAVHKWIKARKISKIDYASKLAELAGMKVQELRPTL